MWHKLIRTYWNICLFKKSPADSPYSVLLLVFMGLLFLLLIVFQWSMSNRSIQASYSVIIGLGCLLLLSYMIYTFVLLWISRRIGRNVQTLTCLFACHTIVHVIALPLVFIVPIISAMNGSSFLTFIMNVLFLAVSLMLSVWQFMVTAHIYKHALMLKTPASLLASLGLLAVNILMISFW